MFLRVGITKYYKLHQNMLTDRVDGTPNPARALTNTVRPPIAKAIWGMTHTNISCIPMPGIWKRCILYIDLPKEGHSQMLSSAQMGSASFAHPKLVPNPTLATQNGTRHLDWYW